MKKIFYIIIMLFMISTSYANIIPGFLEVDLNYARYLDLDNIGASECVIKYGTDIKIDNKYISQFSPYMFTEWKTFFESYSLFSNGPFRDNYTFGIGFMINKFLYIEWEHKCSHTVFSEKNSNSANMTINGTTVNIEDLYQGYPTLSYDQIKIGIKFKID